MSDDLFPELGAERDHLQYSLRCRDAMIERFSRLDPDASADEITKEYIEVTVAEALEDLQTPGAGEFFGRITEAPARPTSSRRHLVHRPAPHRGRRPRSGGGRLAGAHRRAVLPGHRTPTRSGSRTAAASRSADGDLTAYLDEQLDDPDHDAAGSGIPDPVLAEIGAARTGAMQEIVATIQAEQDVVIRAPLDQVLVVQGGPGTGKTAVGLHRAAYLLFEHRRRLVRDGVLVVGPNRVFLDYIGNVLPSLGERSVQQRTALDLCVPKVDITGVDTADAAPPQGQRGDARRARGRVRAAREGARRRPAHSHRRAHASPSPATKSPSGWRRRSTPRAR